jgi:hypothetical protein
LSTIVAFHYLCFPRTELCRRRIGFFRSVRGFKNQGPVLLWPDGAGVRTGAYSLTDHGVVHCSSSRGQERLDQRKSVPFLNHTFQLLFSGHLLGTYRNLWRSSDLRTKSCSPALSILPSNWDWRRACCSPLGGWDLNILRYPHPLASAVCKCTNMSGILAKQNPLFAFRAKLTIGRIHLRFMERIGLPTILPICPRWHAKHETYAVERFTHFTAVWTILIRSPIPNGDLPRAQPGFLNKS